MKKLSILSLILFATLRSMACDVCGCKLGGLYFGILPQYNTHFIGVRYGHASFKASMLHNSEYLDDEFSHDTYQRIDVMGRYSLSKKFQINFLLPYMHNRMDGSHQKVTSTGIGDPMVLVYYNPFNTGEVLLKNWKHALLIGGGLKLPLGDDKKVDNGKIINRNFQLGSGSLDFLLSANYTLRYNNWGINLESAYKINTANELNYRFGNQMNTSGYLFYYWQTDQVSFLPYTGLYFETAGKHLDGKVRQNNTGGSALFGTMGLQIFRNNFTLNFQYQHPATQNYNSDHIATIEAEERFTVGFLFNFSLKEDTMILIDN